MTRYRRIARISRVKGLAGEVVAVPIGNLPFHFQEGTQLWIVPPDHALIRQTRVRMASWAAETFTLTLEGINDSTTAQRLVGRYLLARVEDSEYEREKEQTSLVGLNVVDKTKGFIGTIVKEQTGSAQSLLVVQGPFGEVLIPAVDEFIGSRDDATVFMELPEGLVELNR